MNKWSLKIVAWFHHNHSDSSNIIALNTCEQGKQASNHAVFVFSNMCKPPE